MSTLSDPTLAAAIEHLPKIREEVAGCLSEPETAYTLDAEHAKRMRAYHADCLERTTNARHALVARLNAGLPKNKPLPDGGYSAMDGLQQHEARRLIHRYCVESRCLYRAAQYVCDAEELADDGAAEGIVWEVPL